MRLALLALLTLSACASGPTPLGGYAGYDALKAARDACEAKGQQLVLRDQGDARDISQYTCKRK